jgi:CRP-like cAMP-binding protein
MNPVLARSFSRLEHFSPIGEEEKAVLAEAAVLRRYGPHQDLAQEGEPSDGLKIVLAGLACRYKVLPDGRRQIVAYFVPGDMCDVALFASTRMDHSIGSLSNLEIGIISKERVSFLVRRYPRILQALCWAVVVEGSISREWLVNVGHRTALERTAHLFCELYVRLSAVGLAQEGRCELPLTQMDLADTLALSAVHVNRTLMEMRRAQLVSLQNRVLHIPSWDALSQAAGFDPAYLHLDEPARTPQVLAGGG